MNLRQRFGLILAVGLVLGLTLLGRELFRADDSGPVPASTEKVSAPVETPVAAAPSTTVQAAPAPEIAPEPNVSSATGTFRGRVIDAATRQPVREFALEFHPMHRPQPEDVAPGARKFQSKDGRFEWQGIPPRLWMITASAQGYRRFDLEQVRIPAEKPTEIVIPLQRGYKLRGRVYDETSGAGIASALVTFREAHIGRYEGNFRMRVNTTTGKDGSFVLEGVPAGAIIVSVSAPQRMGREIDAFISEQMAPLQISLSAGGAITGYLAAGDGVTPIAGIVGLSNIDEGQGVGMRTGEAGEFTFEHLRPGRYRVTGQVGNRNVAREISLGKDERKDGVVLALSGGRSVRGVVTGVRPGDLERVRLTIQRNGSFSDTESGVDARGAYEIQGVEPGSVTVTAIIDRNRQISKTVQVPADADVVANLEFPTGARLSGTVTRGGKPMGRFWLEPRAIEQRQLYIHGTQTSERGEYVIEDVPDGEYYIILNSYRSRNFKISGDTVFDIDVPVTNLSGRTVEEGGKVPVVGADIYIWSTSTGMHWHDQSNHFGEFSVIGPEAGDYIVSAYKPGYEMYRERISYSSASGSLTIRLRPGNGVEVRLREAGSGRPIRNAQVGETVDGHPGSGVRLRLDENGVGYLPSAMAGSTLTFYSRSYARAVVPNWDGQELEVQLQPEPAR